MGDIKERIRQANDIKREVVHVDAWDMDIEVRAIAGADVGLVFGGKDDDRPEHVYRADMIIATCFDPETGEKIFEPTDEDRELINGKSAFATGPLLNAAMRLNGLTEEGRDELKNG